MTEEFDPEKIICTVDDEEVSCKTWEPISKEEGDEIESMMDFIGNYDN